MSYERYCRRADAVEIAPEKVHVIRDGKCVALMPFRQRQVPVIRSVFRAHLPSRQLGYYQDGHHPELGCMSFLHILDTYEEYYRKNPRRWGTHPALSSRLSTGQFRLTV